MTHVDRDTLALLALEPETGEAGLDERAHLEACADCRQALEDLCETAALVSSLEDDERDAPLPPPRVWNAIVTELAESGHLPAGPPSDGESAPGPAPDSAVRELGPGRSTRSPWPWLAAAAAVVVLALVAVSLAVGGREPEPSLVADATLEPLAEVEAATARLLEDADGLKLEIETAGLPEPDGYYELWLIDTEVTRLISLGPLDEGQRYRLPAGLDIAAFPVIDVSLEPFDGDPAHSGNSVLRGVLPVADGAEG